MSDKIQMMNWWCPECLCWLASEDMNEARRHKLCNARAEWREYDEDAFEQNAGQKERG